MNADLPFDESGPLTPKMWNYLEQRGGLPTTVKTVKGHTLWHCGTCYAMIAIYEQNRLRCDCGGRYFRPVKSKMWLLSDADLGLLATYHISPQ